MMHEFFPMFITQIWQVTLLAVVVWIVTKTCCKRRPHLGHALWLLVLIKCIVPPVFSSSTGVYSWILSDNTSPQFETRIAAAAPPTAVASSPNFSHAAPSVPVSYTHLTLPTKA